MASLVFDTLLSAERALKLRLCRRPCSATRHGCGGGGCSSCIPRAAEPGGNACCTCIVILVGLLQKHMSCECV